MLDRGGDDVVLDSAKIAQPLMARLLCSAAGEEDLSALRESPSHCYWFFHRPLGTLSGLMVRVAAGLEKNIDIACATSGAPTVAALSK
jgi:hypothetical protein